MSSKSSQGKKISFKPKVRSMEEIQKEYQELVFRAGSIQYQVYAHSIELETVQKRMRDLNLEAAQRNELDKKAKEAEQPPKETATETKDAQ